MDLKDMGAYSDLIRRFNQLMDKGENCFRQWHQKYETDDQLNQIQQELLKQLNAYCKCLTLNLSAYFLIAFTCFSTQPR